MNGKKTSAAGEEKKERCFKASVKKVWIGLVCALLIGTILGLASGFVLGRNSIEPFQRVMLKSFDVSPEYGDGAVKTLEKTAKKYAEETGYTVDTTACWWETKIDDILFGLELSHGSVYRVFPTLIGPNKVKLEIDFRHPIR